MKLRLKLFLGIVLALILIGFVMPLLFSAKSTEAVIGGIVILGIICYAVISYGTDGWMYLWTKIKGDKK